MKRILMIGPDFCAAAEDGLLVEMLRTDSTHQNGDILLGTVERIMPGIGCAFVNIGRRKAGFLPLKENSLTFCGEALRSGQRVAVQIRKEETGEKGAFLTRDLTLAGQTVLYMPCNRYIGVSARIHEEDIRNELRRTGREIAGDTAGIVMREASLAAGKDKTAAEARRLAGEWQIILQEMRNASGNGTVLYHQSPVSQMIGDYESKGIEETMKVSELPPAFRHQLDASLERRIPVGNGGNIVVDQCEAMTVIDVNTGSFSERGNPEQSFTEMNLCACETIVAQIRLRDLGGIILIDFIDMDSESDRERVQNRLLELTARDRRKIVIHGWTRLGLMEITRKRTGS